MTYLHFTHLIGQLVKPRIDLPVWQENLVKSVNVNSLQYYEIPAGYPLLVLDIMPGFITAVTKRISIKCLWKEKIVWIKDLPEQVLYDVLEDVQ